MMGLVVAKIPLFTGVESSSPLKKESILMHMPVRAAKNKRK